ncbi:MAG: type II toxin-antitoxin system prevent-host-death family antitoxin [Pontiellaceae bacterium]|nr:type II toxin-antitoxin system prevent-host-death family antitoxin [Pontiellaceae bacterium]
MRITTKDLRYNLKNILGFVDRGEEVVITNRGCNRARIIPVEKDEPTKEANPFVGMWADRDDIADVDVYVRELRKGRVSC